MLNFNNYSIFLPLMYYLGIGNSNHVNTTSRIRPTNSAFPFFHLPPEIRNQVYSILFLSDHKWHLITPNVPLSLLPPESDLWPYRPVGISDSLSLLRTCQQAHEEATAILYGRNIFQFDDKDHMDTDHDNYDHGGPGLKVVLTQLDILNLCLSCPYWSEKCIEDTTFALVIPVNRVHHLSTRDAT